MSVPPAVTYAQGWEETLSCSGTQTHGYGFKFQGGFDLNQNQMVESGDIATWLETPADFNGDEAANAVDLALLITAVVNGEE